MEKDKLIFHPENINKKISKHEININHNIYYEQVAKPRQYSALQKIKNWRKMFLNEYESQFTLYDVKWNSIREFYEKMKDVVMSKYKKDIKLSEYDKIMKLAFFAKITQNEELQVALLATNNAELYCENIETKELELCDNLMTVRDCIRKFELNEDSNLSEVSQFSSEIIDMIMTDTKILQHKAVNEIFSSEKKEIHTTDAITITFGDQAENHAGMQKLGKMKDSGFTVDELKRIKKEMEEKGFVCELVKLNKALPAEFKERAEKASVLVIKGLLRSFELFQSETLPADELFHELKTVKWDTFLVSTRTTEIQMKHARANICIANPPDIPEYTKENFEAHKNSDYWQDENLSILYKKQQDQRKEAEEKVKLTKAEIQGGKGTIVKWETLSVLEKFKKFIENNFGEHAKDLVAEGNSYTDLKKCYIGPHGDTERRIVIAIRLGKPFPMYFHWYHKSKPIGDLITLPELNHGDVYIMSEKAVGQDWKSSSKITLRHSAGFCDKAMFKK